ncbi:hypothetical protein ACRALDRAFT_1055341 [Sodiomyces alcalophilus JCM 7366]|uniref:uncharacterized protein n=1 Tax=Sodiomyces alcalophilus JCM 7366 TaxID=591952 RepID=UPI0039B414E3
MAEKRKRSEAPEGGKSKKAKAAKKEPEPIPVPEEMEVVDAAVTQPEEPSKEVSKKKSSKKDKKSPKKSKAADETQPEAEAVNGDEEQSATKKKTKKSKSKKSEPNGDAPAEPTKPEADSESKPDTTEKDDDASSKPPSKRALKKARKEAAAAAAAAGGEVGENANGTANQKAPRYIAFVGNLPFTANESTIRQHFAAFKPTSIRCLTKDGVEGTCRGFAFIEFANPAHMRTCLDKMHHTTFNDGVSPARKINVELTAGGGGSKAGRKEKIKQRNEKLAENRAKRIEKEKQGKKANATGEDQHVGMHPSRLAMIS